ADEPALPLDRGEDLHHRSTRVERERGSSCRAHRSSRGRAERPRARYSFLPFPPPFSLPPLAGAAGAGAATAAGAAPSAGAPSAAAALAFFAPATLKCVRTFTRPHTLLFAGSNLPSLASFAMRSARVRTLRSPVRVFTPRRLEWMVIGGSFVYFFEEERGMSESMRAVYASL